MLRSSFGQWVVGIILAGVLLGGMEGLARYECTIQVIPPTPTPQDSIILRLSSVWPNSCVPIFARVLIMDNDINIDIRTPSGPCAQVLTPWTFDVPIGPLPAGTYRVVVTRVVAYPELGILFPGAICRTSFVVIPVQKVGPPPPPVRAVLRLAMFEDVNAGIKEAIRAYRDILGKANINVANAA